MKRAPKSQRQAHRSEAGSLNNDLVAGRVDAVCRVQRSDRGVRVGEGHRVAELSERRHAHVQLRHPCAQQAAQQPDRTQHDSSVSERENENGQASTIEERMADSDDRGPDPGGMLKTSVSNGAAQPVSEAGRVAPSSSTALPSGKE